MMRGPDPHVDVPQSQRMRESRRHVAAGLVVNVAARGRGKMRVFDSEAAVATPTLVEAELETGRGIELQALDRTVGNAQVSAISDAKFHVRPSRLQPNRVDLKAPRRPGRRVDDRRRIDGRRQKFFSWRSC